MTRSRAAVWLLLLGACDPHVDPNYRGEALATLRGAVVGEGDASEKLSVAILWFTSSETSECSGPGLACWFAEGEDPADGGDPYDPSASAECIAACGPGPDECDPQIAKSYQGCVEACGAESYFEYGTLWELCADGGVGAKVPVMGAFPAKFKLDLFSPPPPEALLTSTTGGPAVALGWILVVNDQAPDHISFDEPDPVWNEALEGGAEQHMVIYAAQAIPADSGWGVLLGGAYEPGYHVVAAMGGGLVEGTTDVYEVHQLVPSPDDLATEITVRLAHLEELNLPVPG